VAPHVEPVFVDGVRGDAATAVHVGDDPVLDVLGAQRAGMRVIQVRSSKRWNSVHPDLTIAKLAELPAAIERLDGGS